MSDKSPVSLLKALRETVGSDPALILETEDGGIWELPMYSVDDAVAEGERVERENRKLREECGHLRGALDQCATIARTMFRKYNMAQHESAGWLHELEDTARAALEGQDDGRS